MHGRVYNDVCAFVANPEAVAMSLKAQQAKVPSLGALHNIAKYGLNVGVMVRGYRMISVLRCTSNTNW